MHVLMAIYGQPRDPAAFRHHYETVHLPLVRQLPGLRTCTHSYAVGSFVPDENVFCVFQALFDSPEALTAAMQSEAGARLAADGPNYATGGMRLLTFPRME